MSRSIKKHMGGTWVVCKNVKSDRKVYHSNERAKVREQLKAIKDDLEDDSLDNKIIKNKIDRDVYFGDPYSWGSDGGSYLQETISDLKVEITKVLADKELFIKYLKSRAKTLEQHWRYCYHSRLEESALAVAPDNLINEDELIEWISNNQERIFEFYKKKNYGK